MPCDRFTQRVGAGDGRVVCRALLDRSDADDLSLTKVLVELVKKNVVEW